MARSPDRLRIALRAGYVRLRMRGQRRSGIPEPGGGDASESADGGRDVARPALMLAVAAPMAAYLALVVVTRVDAPVLDDFDALLGFAERFASTGSWSERLALLFQPHVDHRIALPRAVALAVAGMLGRIDFAVLSLLGNLCLVGAFLALAAGRERDRYGLAGLVPASLLVFQPQAVDVVHWPTASLATHGVLALATVAFRWLETGTRVGLAVAWLCGLLALYTQGNGVALWPAAAGGLWLAGRRREAWRWLALSVPALVLYASTYAGHAGAGGVSGVLHRLPETVHYFLNFLGAAPAFGSVDAAPALAAVLCGGLGWLLFSGRERLDPGLAALGLFVMITAAGNAVLRSGMGTEYALEQSRYRLYSVLLVVVCHLGLSDRLRTRRWRGAYLLLAIGMAAAFSAVSFVRDTPAVGRNASIAARSVLRWSLTGEGLQHPKPERAAALLSGSALYRPDPSRLARFLDRREERRVPTAVGGKVGFDLVRVMGGESLVMVEGWMAIEGVDPSRAAIFVVRETPGERAVFGSRRVRGVAIGAEGSDRLAFRALIPRWSWGDEPARIGLLGVDREVEVFVPTSRVVR